MAPLANQALKQINEKYADKFLGGSNRLVKVALVIARRTFTLAQFEVVEGQSS
jgi:hypothetical protein